MERANIKDMLNYEPDRYLSDEDIELIKQTCSPRFLKVLRKLFLPSWQDPELPVEELESDLFLQGKNWGMLPADEAKILAVSRQESIQFVMNGLIKLRNIANIKSDSELSRAERRRKDSAK